MVGIASAAAGGSGQGGSLSRSPPGGWLLAITDTPAISVSGGRGWSARCRYGLRGSFLTSSGGSILDGAQAPHGLRRYVVTRLFDAGVDPGVAAKITGHSEIVAMQLYRQVTPSRLREAVAKARLGAVAEAAVIPITRASGE